MTRRVLQQTACAFCDYAGPSPILADYGDVIVFEPLNPVTPGHVLVVPKEHADDAGASLRLTGLAFAHAADWAARKALPSYNLITSRGAPATQTVRHLHVHVVPRTFGDRLALPWGLPRE